MKNERVGQLVPKEHAVRLGLKRFFSGVPCSQGHVDERYTRDGQCVECAREKLRRRYRNDPVKWGDHSRKYTHSEEALVKRASRVRHLRTIEPDRYRKYEATKRAKIVSDPVRLEKERQRQRDKQARAYRKDPEKLKTRSKQRRLDPLVRQQQNAACREYKRLKPEVVAELNRKHNPLRRAAVIRRTPPWLTEDDKHQMYLIYKDAHSRGLHVDHIVPLRGKLVSGLHVPWNLQPLEPVENSRKRNHFEVTV